ncbi:MAG: hypothetical protein OEY77_10075 [Nitrospira sp.]|nr:hypothetical protein [Nitrospira sp.]
MRKWHAQGLATCLVLLMTTLPASRATSTDTPSPDGPSQDETLAFIKDTWEACATMHSGWERMTAKDGSLWHVDRMAKVDVVVMPPSTLRLVTRQNERRRLSGIFEIQTPEELIQEFDLNTLSPDVSPERAGEDATLYGIRLHCARAACVTEWVASLAIPGKPLHDLKTGKLAVTNLDELAYVDGTPKNNPGEKKGEAYVPVCDKVALESLSKAFTHAINNAGGKKPLF